MTDTLTPVLTANWDQPDSFTIEGYRRFGGYKALPKALAMEPDDVIATVTPTTRRATPAITTSSRRTVRSRSSASSATRPATTPPW